MRKQTRTLAARLSEALEASPPVAETPGSMASLTMEMSMTTEFKASEQPIASGPAPGWFARLTTRLRRTLSAVNQHCEAVESAKAVCDRENTLKHGKDWTNRCCG
jgi:hypothetical protein